MNSLKGGIRALLLVNLVCAGTSVLAHPADGDGAYSIGQGAKFQLLKEINIPAGVDITYFDKGQLLNTTWNTQMRGTYNQDHYFKMTSKCSFSYRDLNTGLGRADYDRLIPAGTELEVTGVQYEIFPDSYKNGTVREDRDAYIWFQLGKSETFHSLICSVNSPAPGVPAQFMTLGEMKRQFGDSVEVLPADPRITK